MARMFATRILREPSKGLHSILDAGCGDGLQALYLARKNLGSLVHGYDISTEAIAKANGYKQRHCIQNATFSVASHDDFEPQHKMEMVYTAYSLVGEDEAVHYTDNPLYDNEELVRRRLARFGEILMPGGIYVFIWTTQSYINEDFIVMARDAGLESRAVIEHDSTEHYLPIYGLIFDKK